MRNLLILSCSGRKRPDPQPIPAFDRYDGVAYAVVRKALREVPGLADRLTIVILSAEYGLIAAEMPIPWYDRRMDAQRAAVLAEQISVQCQALIGTTIFARTLIHAGRTYQRALTPIMPLLQQRSISLDQTCGGIGERLGQMKAWLRSTS